MAEQRLDFKYIASAPTLMRFHASPAKVRITFGPMGSGKTYAMCGEVMKLALEMPPCLDGVRRSRWCFVRDTTTNLHDTTMQTWLELFPDVREGGITQVTNSLPYQMRVEQPLADGTKLDLLIYCRYQQSPEDAQNLKSLNLTGGLINECDQVPHASLKMLIGRTGRFPSKKNLPIDPNTGKPVSYRACVICDANMTDDEHYLYKLSQNPPHGWEFFRQPPAFFAEQLQNGKVRYTPNRGQKIAQGILPAENIDKLPEGWEYYTKQMHGNTHDWIKIYICAQFGSVMRGIPVYPSYNDLLHYVDSEIKFDPTKTLFLGFDWGLTPSVVFVQMSEDGQLQVIDEIDGGHSERHGIEYLWNTSLRAKLMNEYGWGRGTQVFAVGDPAGTGRSQVDDNTPMRFLMSQGLTVIPCRTNTIRPRLEAVDHFLRSMASGKPAFILSKKAQALRKGFQGNYVWKERSTGGNAGIIADNDWTHIQDALQYICHAIKHADEYNIVWRNRNEFDLSACGKANYAPTGPTISMVF